mmetsp:Transcript_30235/g.84494  ORF Transcript_30235/g.84494 Transcript_30235/m.84494 type:complete len:320 (-) Transcript_30235:1621-2580(-)
MEEEDDSIILQVDNVHKTYLLGIEGIAALRGVSVKIHRGEFICIYGTSGGGKTSLLNILGTIDKPTKGSLDICGIHVANHTSDRTLADLRLRHLGFVFQTFNLLPALTAQENVELPMVLAGELSAAERRARSAELLGRVGLSHRLEHVPSQLSGGEQQRVAIARSIANKPELLLLDEPTGDLDSVNSALVMQHLLQLNRDEGITIIMVTHDVGIKFFADRIIWLRDGKIQRIETVSEELRNESVDTLHEKLHEIEQQNAQPGPSGSSPLDHDVPEVHPVSPSPSRAPSSRWVIREPTDYQTHPQHDPSKASKLSSAVVQ